MTDIRIMLTAPKGKTSSLVKLDDIHIREVSPKELMSWDFEAEDCFTKDFTKDSARLSTCETSGASGRVLKIKSMNESEKQVRFKVPGVSRNTVLKIYLKAMLPKSDLAQNSAKIRLVNIGDFSKWEIGEIRASGEFETFKKEICLPDFYGVGDNLENAS